MRHFYVTYVYASKCRVGATDFMYWSLIMAKLEYEPLPYMEGVLYHFFHGV